MTNIILEIPDTFLAETGKMIGKDTLEKIIKRDIEQLMKELQEDN